MLKSIAMALCCAAGAAGFATAAGETSLPASEDAKPLRPTATASKPGDPAADARAAPTGDAVMPLRPSAASASDSAASPRAMPMRKVAPLRRVPALSRAALLEAARRAPASGMTFKAHQALMRAIWMQDLDRDGNQELAWQSGQEPLGPKVGTCVVVDYAKQAAKKEKDPAKPGVWIETPEAWVPKGWMTWAEVLGATTLKGTQCLAYGVVDQYRCMTPDGSAQIELKLTAFDQPQSYPCQIGGSYGVCQGYLPGTGPKARCQAQGGVYTAVSKIHGCESWSSLGPESLEAFLSVAARNFEREDHNRNGVIDAGEGTYLCGN